MSKKKSYMNRENIISEGFFDKFKKGLSSLLPFAKANKESKKHWKKAEKSADEFKKALEAFAKANGEDLGEVEKEFWDSVK